MTLAAVHFSPMVSLPVALILTAVLVWYWLQLGKREVPRSRRLIRRTSLVMSFLVLMTATIGVSFIDPRAHQTAYVVTWAIVIFLILLIMVTAVVDIFNSLRVQRELRTRMQIEAAADLHRAIKEVERESTPRPPTLQPPTTNGWRDKNGHTPGHPGHME